MSRVRGAAWLIAALATLAAAPAHVQTEEEKTRAKLEQLKEEMTELRGRIEEQQAKRNSLQQALAQAETRLGRLEKDVRETQEKLANTRTALDRLSKEREKLEAARESQRERVSREMLSAYQMQQRGQLKVLLSDEDPQQLTRNLVYYRYFLAARQALLQHYHGILEKIAANEAATATREAELEAARGNLQRQRSELLAAQQERREALATLNTSLKSGNRQLAQMQEDRKQLEELLDTIQRTISNIVLPEDYKPFSAVRGKLPWPVAASPANRFGSVRNSGRMRWQGLVLPAPEGTTVKAVHYGRVVYADWLRGYGLLLIIDHGNNYMSLYAHNQSLLHEVGEWVTAGSPVSTVGTTGGREEAALYFEIRHNGQPVDPRDWCAG